MPGSTIGTGLDQLSQDVWRGEITITKTGDKYIQKTQPKMSLDENVNKSILTAMENVAKNLNQKA